MTTSPRGRVVWVSLRWKGLGARYRRRADASRCDGRSDFPPSHGLARPEARLQPVAVSLRAGSVPEKGTVERGVGQLPNGTLGRLDGPVKCAGINPSLVRSELLDVQTSQQILATNTVARSCACVQRAESC